MQLLLGDGVDTAGLFPRLASDFGGPRGPDHESPAVWTALAASLEHYNSHSYFYRCHCPHMHLIGLTYI